MTCDMGMVRSQTTPPGKHSTCVPGRAPIGYPAGPTGIVQFGSEGNYSYGAKDGWADRPVGYVTWVDAMRFANWLHNGQGLGDTGTGAYTLLGGTPVPSNFVVRNAEATVFLPSEDEWYKAAYYDPGLQVYYDYPTGTDDEPTCEPPQGGDNSVNCLSNVPRDTGAYVSSPSPHGTFDQGGNVEEWTEQGGSSRVVRGGHFRTGTLGLLASSFGRSGATTELDRLGFRVATVPEPTTSLLSMAALLAVALLRRGRFALQR